MNGPERASERITVLDGNGVPSFAVSAGANVKAVQQMLGHRSAAMTPDVYADLFDGDLDSVSDALNHGSGGASVGTQLRVLGGCRRVHPKPACSGNSKCYDVLDVTT